LLITGGGQVVADTAADDQIGPGDTIAFVASEERGAMPDADSGVVPADGSVQVVKTSEAGGGSRPSIIFNGEVTCILDEEEAMDEPDMARFGGFERADSDGDGTPREPFVVDVVDTGDENRGTDMIEFRISDNPTSPCEDTESGTVLNGTTLARGNLKVDTASSGR
jgi:hypothetical protein